MDAAACTARAARRGHVARSAQPAAQPAPPQLVGAAAPVGQPFAMVGTAQAAGTHQRLPQIRDAAPVKLERTGQQDLLGIEDDVDQPPFLKR